MRRLVAILLVFSLLPFASAASDELYDFDRLTLKLVLDNTITIANQGPSPMVEELTADLTWYPRVSYRQEVVDQATIPASTQEEGAVRYEWTRPRTGDLDFQLNSVVKTSNRPYAVKQQHNFPIESLPADIAYYTQAGELIDINEDIQDHALTLVVGKRDLFEVVYTVADWVTTNIEYNLTTLTATANQPSSWVYDTRYGVCDELTSLFISMLRSLGIPSRFVSGVSYTNLPQFAEPWGGHGWAEVYFPGTGWVPFDVTYGTYGYVDATHIKLKDSLDSGGSSIDFTMSARDAGLVTRSLGIDVQVMEKRRMQEQPFTVTMEPFDDTVGLESYNLVTATIKNNAAQYVSARLQLAKTQNLELAGAHERNVLLKPRESKKLYFLLSTTGLGQGFKYEFPIKIYAGFRELAETSFNARQGFNTYNKAFFNDYVRVTSSERAYDDSVLLSCTTSDDAVYVDQEVTASCTLANEGTSRFQAVQACIDDCQRLDLNPGEEETFTASFTCTTPGVKNHLATATNRMLSTHALFQYECVGEAQLSINELDYPTSLAYDEANEITFLVRKESDTLPKDVDVRILHDNYDQSWHLDEFLQPQKFTLSIGGNDLDNKNNEIAVIITYKDKLGKAYETREDFVIAPRDFTFGQKFMVGMYNLERWLEGLFS